MAGSEIWVDISELLAAVAELDALTRDGVPGYLRPRIAQLEVNGVAVELPPDPGTAGRYGPSPELLCILVTLRALKGAHQVVA